MDETVPKLYNALQQGALLYKDLLCKTQYLKDLDKKVKHYLEPNLRMVCQVVNVHEHTLILGAHTSGYTARVRYAIPELQHKIQQDVDLLHFTKIQCKTVLPVQGAHQKATKKCRPIISVDGRDAIATLSTVISDPKLREALKQFGQHVKNKMHLRSD